MDGKALVKLLKIRGSLSRYSRMAELSYFRYSVEFRVFFSSAEWFGTEF
jgi:hypothetical protein